jgi:hypothetical protein
MEPLILRLPKSRTVLSYCCQLESADSDRNSVFCKAPKLMDPEHFFLTTFTMPKAKQFGEAEKSKGMAWFDEGIMPKEIAEIIGRNAYSIRKIIRIHKDLLLSANPLLPKKCSGKPWKNELHARREAVPLHPSSSIRNCQGAEGGSACWLRKHLCQNHPAHVPEAAEIVLAVRRLEVPPYVQGSEKEAGFLQKAPILDRKRLRDCYVLRQVDIQPPHQPVGVRCHELLQATLCHC